MNKRKHKDRFNCYPWRRHIHSLLNNPRITTKERDFLTKCQAQQQLSKRQEKLLKSIEKSYCNELIKKRKYPGYNIPGYDIPDRQRNLIKELNRPDLQAV